MTASGRDARNGSPPSSQDRLAVEPLEGSPPPPREAPIEMSPDAFRAIGHRLVDRLADFFARLAAGPVTRDASPHALRALLGGEDGLPQRGADPLELLESAAALLFEHSLFNGHPRFLGYITAAPAPIGILGDFLASAVNANAGAWRLSPMASEIEAQAIRWLAELVRLPASTGGLMVSGGSMANTVALLAARRAACDWDLRRAGVLSPNGSALRVYASDATHTWLHKAVDLAGLGTDCIRWIPTDDGERMAVAALHSQIEHDRREGDVPMMVVATAGTVSTGAVDPLFEIADVCARAGVWMHVDGCYGGVAACVPGTPHDLAALHRADSVALDPHKWLYAPLEAGAVLVRDAQRLRDAFAYHPPYYHFGAEALNYFDLGPQNSRGFRALKVWLALRQVGREGYVQMIGDDIRLSQRLAANVDAHEELELFTQNLSITTFRFVPRDLGGCGQTDDDVDAYLDRVNEALVDELQRSGEAFVSHAIVNGRYVLRPCIVNFRTDTSDLDDLLRTVVHRGRTIDASSRARLMDSSG
jgi:aromatic-L-amino-acid/L-tryptophan decarboxylase